MLRNRVITALVLIPLVIGGILYLPNDILAAVLGLIILLGARELALLTNLPASGRPLLLGAVAVGMAAVHFYLPPDSIVYIQGIASAWWVLVTLMLIMTRRPLSLIVSLRPWYLVLGGLLLVVAWLSATRLHGLDSRGPVLLLLLFILIWLADTAAYFAGRAWGKRKLSPMVSPGKTWAGAMGAIAGAVLFGWGWFESGYTQMETPLVVIALAVFVAVVSIGGDLAESRLKREAGVKDSGALLPGHGGVLDRIDSLIAAAPVFVFGLTVLEQLR